MAEQGSSQSQRVSGSRRTRSQVAPDWSAIDTLILVNEIAAVEADCLKALSTFQKWKIIAETCTALGVVRNSSQCRRKWDSLLLDYNQIKQLELQSGGESYWSLNCETRKELGLPENFDGELFEAIDNLVRARENQSDTDPDNDPESRFEMHDIIKEIVEEATVYKVTEEALARTPISTPEESPERRISYNLGISSRSKRQKRRLTHQRSSAVENPTKCLTEEKPSKSLVEEKPVKYLVDENVPKSNMEENPMKCPEEEKLRGSSMKKNAQKGRVKGKEIIGIEEKEQMMALILHENAERIHSIVTENADYGAADVKGTEAEFVRSQGDKLIACLGNIVKTLDQIYHVVQECE